MELSEAVYGRRSIRSFLEETVPREKIERCVELARWAPSWGNTQPWEVVAADGEKAKELAHAFAEEVKKGAAPRPDISIPVEFPEAHKSRYVGLGRSLFETMGIERGDKTARLQHYVNMHEFFGAPAIVYFTIDGRLNEPYSCLDIGSMATTFCLAAHQEGLGTIYLAASMHYPHIIRRVLNLTEEKKIVIGVALGVPDPTAPANRFRSEREPVEKVLKFV